MQDRNVKISGSNTIKQVQTNHGREQPLSLPSGQVANPGGPEKLPAKMATRDRFLERCEQDIIRLHSAGHEHADTPYLDFSQSGCTYCRVCVDACPVTIDERRIDPKLGTARIDHGTCIAWNNVICQACHDRCDVDAITLEYQRRPKINLDNCIGCGMCISACLMNSISLLAS
jgi:ferredoxin